MQSYHILLAEHEHDVRSNLRLGLTLAGYSVVDAANGREAIEILRGQTPDAAIIDLEVPRVGSVALLAELEATPWRARIPSILLTQPQLVNAAIESVRLGASDFLEKPVSLPELQASLRSVLRQAPPNPHVHGPLAVVREALRSGTFAAVESAGMFGDTAGDADCLNLAGIIHESHGRISSARDYYQRSLLMDPHCESAIQNLLRLDHQAFMNNLEDPIAFGHLGAGHPDSLAGQPHLTFLN